MTGLERSLIGFTSVPFYIFQYTVLITQIATRLWNYNPSNDDKAGDDWNGENFSWFSRKRALPPSLLYYEQDAPSLDNGGRILPSIVRPYPAKTAGIPVRFEYEMTTGEFTFEWVDPSDSKDDSAANTTPSVSNPPRTGHPELRSNETEIFLPSLIAHGRKVVVEGLDADAGDRYLYDEKRQTLFIVSPTSTPPSQGKKAHKIRVSLDPPLAPTFEVNSLWSDFGGQILAVLAVLIGVVVYWILMRVS